MNVKQVLGLAALFVAVVGLLASGAAVGGVAGQDDPPPTPAAYYGQVTLTDGDLNEGVTVEAVVDGEVRDTIETDADGAFGGSGAFDEKLAVEGPVDGNVTFRVGDEVAGTADWESGANEKIDLAIDEVPSDPDDGADTDPDDGADTDPDDGDDDDSGPGGVPAGAAGSGGSGGSGPSDDTPTDEPPVEETVDVPGDATTLGGETATIVANGDGQTSSVAFSGETSVDGVDFGGAVEGDVGVVEYEEAPSETGRTPGASVSVVEISVPESARDSPATIRTRVDADRLAESSTDADAVRLSRHADGEWQGLETSVVDRTDGRVVFETETPGFSMFALSAVSEPEAAITLGSESVEPDESVTLSGVQSTDEYGEIVAYEWDIDGTAETGSTTDTSFSESGEYAVELVVTNDAGETDSTTETVIVESETDDGSAQSDVAATVDEPALFAPRTLGAVVGALLLALLVVALVRRADR